MCIQDTERYQKFVSLGWLKDGIAICCDYNSAFSSATKWRAYVDETRGIENDLQFSQLGHTPEEALDRLFKSVEVWYAIAS